jgi:hypothetical protein
VPHGDPQAGLTARARPKARPESRAANLRFHAPSSSGDRQNAVWIILAVIPAAGIAAALIAVVPRLRRLASRRVRPHLLNIWANAKMIATEPASSSTCWPARPWPSC